ncbi:bifunctional Tim44-like domain/Tim44-like/NTF2-like domain superfamily [Babesia duncani]|uniref:Bifunctional Tim44-like domain/Tim44-like/NTF2-like domain superfamily n=1 Tax=Babesia duncani TaxID=323732 RepID=A0AAD9PL63_9APIC|nr:bifunctional Tim44-like domain/Tim44-like/NTF2-like domain superfamily [Babesia duncani]
MRNACIGFLSNLKFKAFMCQRNAIGDYRNICHKKWSNVYLNNRSFSSSFMQSVIDQVKRDLEKNESLREAINELETEAKISQKVSKFNEYLAKSKDAYNTCAEKIANYKSKSPTLELGASCVKTVAHGLTKVADLFHDEQHVSKNLRAKWRERIESTRKNEAATSTTTESDASGQSMETSLVLAKESAWERFGSRLLDMPILANFFENPVFGQLFGESSIASAIREMKCIDRNFSLPELLELVEHVVAPHIVSCYLEGNAEALKIHCGDCAFNVLNASIRERALQKVTLDPSILILKDVELKGGLTQQECGPWFIFNFTTQQINCLRNLKGQVFAGDVDDIREVTYSMALSKHPNIETPELEYPYMVHEIAIIGNRPCW